MKAGFRRASGRPPSRDPFGATFAMIAIAAGVVFFAADHEAPASAAPISQARVAEPPLPLGPTPDLDLLFTAQVAGWIEPCG